MRRQRSRPMVAGHAGAAGEAPANTLAAVGACLASGAGAMEIDVQLCADGVPVLLHDTRLDRTTNLSGPIYEASLAELRAADAGGGEPVPTLAQVLELVDGRLQVFCELKATPGRPVQDVLLAHAATSALHDYDAGTWSMVHSFSPGILDAARGHAPEIARALITAPVPSEHWSELFAIASGYGVSAVSVHIDGLERDLVPAAHDRGLDVWTWTVDDEAGWDAALTANADGVVTNHPSKAVQYLSSR